MLHHHREVPEAMSPSRSSKPSTAKRVPYKPPRPRRELVTAIVVGTLIVVITATLIWFLRPNRESTATPVVTTPASTVAPTDTTPTESTQAPTDTTAPATTETTAAATG
jgi:hypothetical protein